jgi:hypothetical protein
MSAFATLKVIRTTVEGSRNSLMLRSKRGLARRIHFLCSGLSR